MEAFKQYGWANGWNSEASKEFGKARELHSQDMKDNPDNHEMQTFNVGRCASQYSCKCGFGYGVDSSD